MSHASHRHIAVISIALALVVSASPALHAPSLRGQTDKGFLCTLLPWAPACRGGKNSPAGKPPVTPNDGGQRMGPAGSDGGQGSDDAASCQSADAWCVDGLGNAATPADCAKASVVRGDECNNGNGMCFICTQKKQDTKKYCPRYDCARPPPGMRWSGGEMVDGCPRGCGRLVRDEGDTSDDTGDDKTGDTGSGDDKDDKKSAGGVPEGCTSIDDGRSVRLGDAERAGGAEDYMVDPNHYMNVGPYVSRDGSVVVYRQDGPTDRNPNKGGGIIIHDFATGTTDRVALPERAQEQLNRFGWSDLQGTPVTKDGTKVMITVRRTGSASLYWVYDRQTREWSGELTTIPFSGLDLQTALMAGGTKNPRWEVWWGQWDNWSPNTMALWVNGVIVYRHAYVLGSVNSLRVPADGKTIVYAAPVVNHPGSGSYGHAVYRRAVEECAAH